MEIKKNFFAPLASGLGATRRAAALLLVMMLTTATAWATDKTLSGSESYTAQNGDVLTGSTSGTVTIDNNASITLNDVTITGGIVCEGSATITLVGTNSVNVSTASLVYSKAGIQIGGSGTTLTIRGNGSLTATGGSAAAGIGLGRTWDASVTAGSIVIEGGTVTASGGIGIGIGTVGNSQTAAIDGISIKGGTVNASLGKGYLYNGVTATVGYIKVYDTIDMVDASKITETVTYMHGDDDVTANKTDYFTIGESGDRRIITPKDDTDYTITVADGIENGTLTAAATAKYMETVTVTATPTFGYRLSRLIVKDADNNDVATTANTFLMPKGNVTVNAEFTIGSHGTTEFTWFYTTGPQLQDQVLETIYDGVTTVNIQQTERSYYIRKYEEYTYCNFRLDNDTYNADIPYAGGTGKFYKTENPTNFHVPYEGETGYYDVTLTDADNGKWSVSILKTVAVMDAVPDQTYTGSEITPEPLVIAGSLNLTKGTDYVYSYTNNTDAGTAKVIATFQGDYESLGSVEKEFNIVKATPAVNAPTAVADLVYKGSAQALVNAGSTDFGTLLYSLDGETYSEDIPTATSAGTHTVYYKVAGDNNHNDVFGSLDVTIAPKAVTNEDITVTIPSQTWTGNELTPVITVKDGENVLTENTDYTVTPPSGPIQDSGNHAYTITGMGNYAGSKEATFTISPRLDRQYGAVYIYQDQNGKTALLDGTSVDSVDIDYNHNIIVNHVTSNRVFTPGMASTVMLPFDYTCNGEEGGTFYKFVGVEKENDKWVATMQETGNDANNEGTLEANTPYLFMPTATGMTFPNIPNGGVRLFTRDGGSGGNCETADPGSHWTFKGTYWFKEWNSNDYNDAEEIGRAYGFAGVAKDGINVGDFVRVASGAKIRPMRAYLLWNDMPNSARSFTRGAAATDEELPQSITVRLVGSNGETTGIGTLDTETGEMTFDSEAWYTLDGVRLSGKPTKKGLYINNGKKVVIK